MIEQNCLLILTRLHDWILSGGVCVHEFTKFGKIIRTKKFYDCTTVSMLLCLCLLCTHLSLETNIKTNIIISTIHITESKPTPKILSVVLWFRNMKSQRNTFSIPTLKYETRQVYTTSKHTFPLEYQRTQML